MPAKGIPLLRFAVLCGIGALAGIAAHGQFLESPDTNLFGDDLVRTSDARAGAVVNDRASKQASGIEGYEDVLLFRDGRQLRGRLLSADKNEIIWKRPDFSEPLHLRRTDVDRVYLTPKNGDEGGGSPLARDGLQRLAEIGRSPLRAAKIGAGGAVVPATVKLGGNDWLQGSVKSPDGQSFVIRLDNKGCSITAPQSQVEWLFFDWNPTLGGGFDGGMLNAEDWLASAPSARLADDGTLVIAGDNEWFGEPLPQSPRFEISMEIPADSEQGTHLWLQAFNFVPDTFSSGSVDVRLGPKQLTFRRFTGDAEQQNNDIAVSEPGREAKGMVRYRMGGIPKDVPTPLAGKAGEATEALLVSALDDPERRYGMERDFSNSSVLDPRICDMAAYALSIRWPDKYRFHWAYTSTQCDAQIAEIRNRWRSDHGLPSLPAPLPVVIPPAKSSDLAPMLDQFASASDGAERDALTARIAKTFGLGALPAVRARFEETKNAAFRGLALNLAGLVREVRIEADAGGSAKLSGIASLQGQSLDGPRIVSLAQGLEAALPSDVRSVTFFAERAGDGTGFTVTMVWVAGEVKKQNGWYRPMAVRRGDQRLYDSNGLASKDGIPKEEIYRGMGDAFGKAIQSNIDAPVIARFQIERSP